MKTKLTLLLALALSAESLHAASPNLPAIKSGALPSQAIRPAAKVPNIPMQRSYSSAVRPSMPMIKPSARPAPSSYLPKIPNLRPVVPQYTQSPSRGMNGARQTSPATTPRVAKPAVVHGKSPASRPGHTSLPAKPQVEIRKVVPGLNLPNAEALREGREIAEGLKALDSLRFSGFQNLMPEGLADHGSGRSSGPTDPFANHGSGMREPQAPDHVSGRKSGLADLRGGMNNSRRGNATTGLSRTGDTILQNEVSMASGRSGTSTPVESTTHENGDVTASTTTTAPDGTTTHVEVTEHSDGSGTTTTTQSNDGHTDTLTMTRRDATGAVAWSRTDSVYEGGKQHIVTRDGSGRVTSDVTEYFRPGSRTTDRSPSEGGSLGGPVNGSGPSVAQVAGLVPLDLLRQTAEGTSSGGGANYLTTGRTNSNQVRPVGSEGQTGIGGNQNPVPVNRGSTVVLPGPVTGGGGNPE